MIPRTLAENAGLDPTEVVSKLMEKYSNDVRCGYGVDIEGKDICNVMNEKQPVLDVYATKKNALRLAVNAVLTILKVDQIIMAKEAGGPKLRLLRKRWIVGDVFVGECVEDTCQKPNRFTIRRN